MENKDQPAFPTNHATDIPENGLTKREWLAAMANTDEIWDGEGYTQGYATDITGIEPPEDRDDKKAWHLYWLNIEAVIKIQKADALLTQLSKP